MILLYLPSVDVLKIKLTSASFAALPLPDSFWASRFQRGFEFHCIFEARQSHRKGYWKALYSGVKNLRRSASFTNRYRIWEILLHLEELLTIISHASLDGSVSRSFFEPDAPEDCTSWKYASGVVKSAEESFSDGSRALWTRNVVVPNKVIEFHVSFVRFGNVDYISGLRLRSQSGSDICLGYNTLQNEVSMDLSNQYSTVEGCGISQFHLAIDSRGIRAISLLTSTGHMSKWLGNTTGVPRMRLISGDSGVMALKGSFDVSSYLLMAEFFLTAEKALKLVALGIPDNASLVNLEGASPAAASSFARYRPMVSHCPR